MSPAIPAILAFLSLSTAAYAQSAHFTYEGEHGPDHWGQLSETCAIGAAQSPVDLASAVQGTPLSDLGIQVAWADVGASVLNNGHTIQVEPTAPAGAITVAGTAFQFRQVHFHHLSEHVVNGQHADLEAHFVHQADNGHYLVVGVFLRAGSGMSNMTDFFDQVMEVAPEQPETRTPLQGTLHVGSLLAAGERYYSYDGSLTTPPCSQSVTWLIQAQPLVLDVGQAAGERFVQFIGQNYRPAQPLNGRTVYLH